MRELSEITAKFKARNVGKRVIVFLHVGLPFKHVVQLQLTTLWMANVHLESCFFIFLCLRRCVVDGKHSIHFQNENTLFKFSRRIGRSQTFLSFGHLSLLILCHKSKQDLLFNANYTPWFAYCLWRFLLFILFGEVFYICQIPLKVYIVWSKWKVFYVSSTFRLG